MSTYSLITITKKASGVWEIKDNTTPPGGNGHFQDAWRGGSNGDLVTIKSFNGQIIYDQQPYNVIKYYDELNAGNNLTSPTSAIELVTHLKAQGFFPESDGGGGTAEAFTDLTDTPNSYFGRAGQVATVTNDETGITFSTPDIALQNNTVSFFQFIINEDVEITSAYVADYLNDLPYAFNISSTTSVVAFSFVKQIGALWYKYLFLFTRGKGLWGKAGGSVTDITKWFYDINLKLAAVSPFTESDVQGQPNSEILPLGTIAGNTVSDVVTAANASAQQPYNLNDSGTPDADGYPKTYYFSFTYDGVLYYAVFQGDPGLYGNDGDQPFQESDFAITTDNTQVPEIINTSQLVNDGEDGSSPYVTEEYVDNLELAKTSYVNAACVVRMNSGTGIWEFINDSGHAPIYFSTIENGETTGYETYNFIVNYPAITKIGNTVAGVDETYALQGYNIGGSIGLSKALFRVTKSGMAVRFNCTSGVWSMVTDTNAIVMASDFSGSFNTSNGNLTITHSTLGFYFSDQIILKGLDPGYNPEFVSKTSTSFTLRFRDAGGTILTTANDAMDFIVNRTGAFRVPNANLQNISAGANFWIQGIFHKEGISGNVPFDYPIDDLPVENSDSLVTSGGVYEFIDDIETGRQDLNLKNTSGAVGSGSKINFASGSLGTLEAIIFHELISANTANLNFKVRTLSTAGEAGLTEILALNGGAAPNVQITGKASVSSAPTASTDVVRKTELDLKAPLSSPALTGIPTAPTAAPGTDDTQIATTAFVQSALTSSVLSATATINFPNISAGGSNEQVVTVTGAEEGDIVVIGSSGLQTDLVIRGYCVTTDSVNIRANNFTSSSIDLPSATFNIKVFK